jgi:uncharacterized membrane protein (DUF2068 family)
MRRPDIETLVCSLAGHVTPAAVVRRLRPGDAGVGVDLGDARRLSRCLRCDAWLVAQAPRRPERDVLPAALVVPRRGRALRDAVVLRLIALQRAFHALLAGMVAAALFALELRWAAVQGWARHAADALGGSLAPTDPTRLVVKELRHLAGLRPGTLTVVAGVAAALSALEATEAMGLWRQRRWAEYLTAVATAGLLPITVDQVAARVTVLRVAALAFDVAVLVWLIWAKQLFGVRGRRRPTFVPATISPFESPPLVLPGSALVGAQRQSQRRADGGEEAGECQRPQGGPGLVAEQGQPDRGGHDRLDGEQRGAGRRG